MKKQILSYVSGIGMLSALESAIAGTTGWTINGPTSVPVDAPWALAGVGAIVALVAARILINRRK